MMPTAATATARRRTAALGPRRPPPPRLVRHIDALALPVDSSRIAPAVPTAAGASCAGAVVIAGPKVTLLLVAMAVVGWVALRRSAPRRQAAAVDRDLPLVLEAVARHLRTGASLAQAIAGSRPPREGALAVSWRRLASNVEVVGAIPALEVWVSDDRRAIRPSERLAAAALALAVDTGGSPARAVDGVAATLRSRLAVGDELRALSSQARLSAVVVAVAPLVFAAVAFADGRTAAFFRTGAGAAVLVAGISLDVAGALWMHRLCRIEP